MKLKWSDIAKDDIDRLYSFIYDVNPDAADNALSLIFEEANRLIANPHIGRVKGDNKSMREWLFRFGKRGYIINYKLYENTVLITRIWHARENR
jgi:plasmid stabilization system protein ParE